MSEQIIAVYDNPDFIDRYTVYFEINYWNNQFNEQLPVNLVEWDEIYKGGEVVYQGEVKEILISYPLLNGLVFPIPGTRYYWTREQMYELIRAAYALVYTAPDHFGVWGHGMCDLFIEGVNVRDGRISLIIGS